jgi:hypothetical protein
MAKVTNTLGRSISIGTGVVKDGAHQTISFKPGETKTLTAEQMKYPGIQGYLHAQVLTEAGTQTITCFLKPDDVGQIALKAAELTSNRYAIKVSPRDRLSGGGTDSITYYRGIVRSARKGALSANDPQRIVFMIGIDSALVEVAAT